MSGRLEVTSCASSLRPGSLQETDRRAPPAAHQPGARPTLHFLLIMCETHLPETTWQAWRQKEIEDQLPINRCCLLESELPDGDLWNRPNLSISYRGKLLLRAIIGSLEQLSTPSVRHPHSRHMQGVGLSTSPSRSSGSAQWLSLTLPMLTMLDWLYKLPENMLRRCMCLPSGVSFDYWMTNVLRDASGVRWNERWPYMPDPYRIMDCPQSMLWIGSTVSVDIASAPQQLDDSSDSSAGDYRLLTSANCYGACMQTLRSAQLCVDTYLCINCQNTAPHHPHTAPLVRLCQKIWTPDKAESFGTDVAENQPTNTAKIHRIYTLSMPEIMQASDDLRFTGWFLLTSI